MAECRYFPECQRCNEVGDSWLPCAGGADGTRCKGYEPMPDVEALLALADEMQGYADGAASGDGFPYVNAGSLWSYADRIREACGVVVR